MHLPLRLLFYHLQKEGTSMSQCERCGYNMDWTAQVCHRCGWMDPARQSFMRIVKMFVLAIVCVAVVGLVYFKLLPL